MSLVKKKVDATSPGLALFESFLETNGLSRADAAKALGVSWVTIHSWLDGTKRPSDSRRESIEHWTSGAVPAESWRLEDDRLPISVKPFVPPSAPALTDDAEAEAEAESGPVVDLSDAAPKSNGTEG